MFSISKLILAVLVSLWMGAQVCLAAYPSTEDCAFFTVDGFEKMCMLGDMGCLCGLKLPANMFIWAQLCGWKKPYSCIRDYDEFDLDQCEADFNFLTECIPILNHQIIVQQRKKFATYN